MASLGDHQRHFGQREETDDNEISKEVQHPECDRDNQALVNTWVNFTEAPTFFALWASKQ